VGIGENMQYKRFPLWEKGCLAAIIILILAALLPARSLEAKEDRPVVRVGYPIQQGLTEIDENGNYTGYIYDYLQEIAQYTGWDYEFVRAEGDINESLMTLMEMLENGEIDIMGGMLYNSRMEEMYDYASNSCGIVYTVLKVLYEDTAFNEASREERPLRVAMIDGAAQRREELEEYCRMNMLIPEIVPCDTEEEMLQALKENRADVMLSTSMEFMEGLRTVARFSPRPFYFVSTKGKTDLLNQLDKALQSIEQADPYFSASLYEQYFNPPNTELWLTSEEKKYVETAGTLKVGVLSDLPPYQYTDEVTGQLKGIGVDLLEKIQEQTGLSFQLVVAPDEKTLNRMAAEGSIDLVAGMNYDYELAKDRNVAMSRPYITTQYMLLISDRMQNRRLEEMSMAMVDGCGCYWEKTDTGVYFQSREDIVRAINSGKPYYSYMDAYVAQYYFNKTEFKSLKLIPQISIDSSTCIGVVKPASTELLSILNKVIQALPQDEMQSIIYANTIFKESPTLADYIKENPFQAAAAAGVVIFLIIAALAWGIFTKEKLNRKITLELAKHREIYGLVNDYFFEYDIKKDIFTISMKPDGNGEERTAIYNLKSGTDEKTDYRKQLLEIMVPGKDGIRELQLPEYKQNQTEDTLTLIWIRLAMKTIYDYKGNPVCIIGKMNDIEEERRERDKLKNQAERDGLTHAYNAKTSLRLIEERLQGLEEGNRGALLLIDIDKFKNINDTYGHMAGDQVLCEVAAVLRECFREEDIVGRPGGDEFVVYMDRMKENKALADTCERLLQNIRKINAANAGKVTISVGAVVTKRGDRYDEVYKLADNALYQAKREGRDGFFIA